MLSQTFLSGVKPTSKRFKTASKYFKRLKPYKEIAPAFKTLKTLNFTLLRYATQETCDFVAPLH
ncbi:MAG: hypothetical protein J6M14_01555 [Campylobacter sp.]|nr:hypothetical protein [Campylobacter sp.]